MKSIARFTITPDGLIVGVTIESNKLKVGHVYTIREDSISESLGADPLSIREVGISDFNITEPTGIDKLLAISGGTHLTVGGK